MAKKKAKAPPRKRCGCSASGGAEALRKLVGRLLAACEAKDDMLVCYRVQRRPSEALFKRLDKADRAMQDAKAALAQEQPR